MATRIDIELTSDRGDGTFTWRAAGAKQPKGTVEATLIPEGVKLGQRVRAEVEFSVDGPELVAIEAPKGARVDKTVRLEIKGSGKKNESGVTTQLKSKGRNKRRGGPRRGDSNERPTNRGPRKSSIKVRRSHRQSWIDSLPAAHQAVAEQMMYEGRSGVEDALKRQNKAAQAAGRETIDYRPVMRIADELLPSLQAAEWRDNAAGAIDAVDSADLRDLRKVLNSGQQHLEQDPSLSSNLEQLATKLQTRVQSDQSAWGREIREALKEGRLVRALRSSARPAKAGAPLPQDLVEALVEATSAALDPEEEQDRYGSVLEALANSPIRRLVVPETIPEKPSEDLLDTVDRYAQRIPEIADKFGIKPRKNRRR